MAALVPTLQAGSQFGVCKFSHDSKFLFTCCGSVIKVFNTANGELVHDLEGHMHKVTGVMLNPSNVLQLISCGTDGHLIYWDYLDGVILTKHDLHLPLHTILVVNAEKKSILMLAQLSEFKKTYGVMLWKRNKEDSFEKPKTLLEDCSPDHNLVSFGCLKTCIAAGVKNRLAIHLMKSGKNIYLKDTDKFNMTKAVTCVACHPTESCVAAGLENGRIFLWRNFLDDKAPVSSMVHWHSLPVKCIGFSPDGSCMFSGGHECVLVRWQFGSQNNRDFKPRMGAPLQAVQSSPDGTLMAVNTSNNVIQLLDINLKVLLVYQGLTRCNFTSKQSENPIPCGLLYDPRSRALITNGLPGHLQFYSMTLNKQLYNLDIVGQNYISPENLDRPSVVTQVTSAAVNHDGMWVATFEVWDDKCFSPEMRLKFWMYSAEAQTYLLNTRVEHPHESEITSMLFRPPSPQYRASEQTPTLVTLGLDDCFKMWTLVDDTDIYRENSKWTCDSVGFYRCLHSLAADFSCDGSILAVGFEHLLTLWDPDNNVVRKTLSNSLSPQEDIKCIKFGNLASKHHLVVLTAGHLISWDLSTLTVLWCVEEHSFVLIRDPSTQLMAVISENAVKVFRPSCSTMLFNQQEVSSSPLLHAAFIPESRGKALEHVGWPGNSQIYLYNSEQQLITLNRSRSAKGDHANKVKIAQNLPQSALSSFLSQSKARDTQVSQPHDTVGKTNIQHDSYDLLIQSNEPVFLYGNKYLHDLLVKRKQKKRSASRTNIKESDSEEEGPASSSSSESEEDVSMEPRKKFTKTSDNVDNKLKSISNETEKMDSLLRKPLDWVQWCSSLSLK